MKRKLIIQYSLIMSFAVVLFIVLAALLTRNNLNNITKHHLENYLEAVSVNYDTYQNADELVDTYQSIEADVRITVLDPLGNVTADSSGNPLDNHLSRPEFQDLGTIYTRHSDTLNKTLMYVAKEMDDGGYLRVAIPIANILPFINDFILFSILIGIAIIALTAFLIKVATDRTLKPLKDTVASLNAVAKGEYVERLPLEQSEELNQIINDINDISKLIATNISELNSEKQKIDFILNRMDQGLCVLNSDKKVVLVNRFVENLFHYSLDLHQNKDYHYLFRDQFIHQAIEDSNHSVEGVLVYLSIDNRHYSLTVNKMSASWNNVGLYLMVFNDITSMKQIETLKKDFFVNASHELKSPLTSIMGASELITSNLVSNPDEIKDLSARILQEAQRMSNLVQDMLNLSKYENTILSKKETSVDLSAVVTEVKNNLEPLANHKKIEIITYLEPITILADYEHMIQLVRNLMDNAIQYGVEQGHVTVKLYNLGSQIILQVSDDGIGIPKEDQSRVFERFYRVDKARSKKTGGTGLGLAIVKHICALYHAQITLESQLNVGTKISISFPVKD